MALTAAAELGADADELLEAGPKSRLCPSQEVQNTKFTAALLLVASDS